MLTPDELKQLARKIAESIYGAQIADGFAGADVEGAITRALTDYFREQARTEGMLA